MKIKLLLFCFLTTLFIHAQSRYWVASATGNWNDTNNWSATSGGAGGASVPGASDYVIFDANGTGNCDVDISVSLDRFRVVGYIGTLDLLGNNITITSGTENMNFQTGTINDSVGTGLLSINSTANIFFTGTTFGADLSITGIVSLDGSTFNGTLIIDHNGGSNFCEGGNTFNNTVTITKSLDSGAYRLADTNPDIFNDDLIIADVAGGRFQLAYASNGNEFNGSIELNNSDGGWITFGQGGGTSILADGSTITNGINNLDGFLYLNNFTQAGNTVQSITSNSRVFIQDQTTFNADLTLDALQISMSDATFNGTTYFIRRSNSTAASSPGGNTFNGVTTFENLNSAFILDTTDPNIFNNEVTFFANGGEIRAGDSGTGTQFNGDVLLKGTDIIRFGNNGGSSTLADGSTIAIDAAGHTASLYFNNFTQLGNTPQSILNVNNNAIFMSSGTIWNGDLTLTGRLYLNGATFNRDLDVTQSGGGSWSSQGGCTFNGATVLRYTGVHRMGTVNPDLFNDDVTFQYSGPAAFGLDVAYTAAGTEFHGDVNLIIDNNFSQNDLTFGENGGSIIFAGSTDQTITVLGGSGIPHMENVEINKPGGDLILATPLRINSTANFTDGVVITTAANYLEIIDDALISGASNDSHVDGPVAKTGDEGFTFPSGDEGIYQPISISAPSAVSDTFTASFIHEDSNGSYNHALKDPSINNITDVEYWILDRTNGSSNVTVTLNWNLNSGVQGDINDLVVARWDGAEWKDEGNGGTTGNTATGTITTAAPISDFSPFTLASTDPLTTFVEPTLTINDLEPIEIYLYPNPVKDHLYVKLKDLDLNNLRVYSIDGQDVTGLIKIKALSNNSVEISCIDLSSGPYLLSIKGHSQVIIKK